MLVMIFFEGLGVVPYACVGLGGNFVGVVGAHITNHSISEQVTRQNWYCTTRETNYDQRFTILSRSVSFISSLLPGRNTCYLRISSKTLQRLSVLRSKLICVGCGWCL
ncbi:hypothetical protein ANAPC1_01318 [Anaplasma phagocytophilum]|uniref:Uncharacterized protein n=1 Tax=Anaplasma phagocytophilum TaxID=948 RepID=A0AA45UTZ0_ANAPH|nr:hypothetical protein ANAPC1_01318 [Anaplasma phagocytophilum]SCV63233.1 hypothetical protein ANAPC5_00501 [Anaplasma phagocytophilum]